MRQILSFPYIKVKQLNDLFWKCRFIIAVLNSESASFTFLVTIHLFPPNCLWCFWKEVVVKMNYVLEDSWFQRHCFIQPLVLLMPSVFGERGKHRHLPDTRYWFQTLELDFWVAVLQLLYFLLQPSENICSGGYGETLWVCIVFNSLCLIQISWTIEKSEL